MEGPDESTLQRFNTIYLLFNTSCLLYIYIYENLAFFSVICNSFEWLMVKMRGLIFCRSPKQNTNTNNILAGLLQTFYNSLGNIILTSCGLCMCDGGNKSVWRFSCGWRSLIWKSVGISSSGISPHSPADGNFHGPRNICGASEPNCWELFLKSCKNGLCCEAQKKLSISMRVSR